MCHRIIPSPVDNEFSNLCNLPNCFPKTSQSLYFPIPTCCQCQNSNEHIITENNEADILHNYNEDVDSEKQLSLVQ